jgi:hypothetical protein
MLRRIAVQPFRALLEESVWPTEWTVERDLVYYVFTSVLLRNSGPCNLSNRLVRASCVAYERLSET